jgi:hypothetical protein
MADDSHADERDAPQRDPEQRRAAVRRWVEYIKTHPPEEWGPQQNAVVDGQLTAAQAADLSAEHHQEVRAFAADVLESGAGDPDAEEE